MRPEQVGEDNTMPTNRAEWVADGHYAKKQIRCKSSLIAWSHRSRFQFARQLVVSRAGGRLLDYGCGDGTFLTLVHGLFDDSVGADVDQRQIEDCTQRISARTGVSFMRTEDLNRDDFTAAFNVLVCMEVLEHCLVNNRQEILVDLRRLAAPNATVIVSVPIEIGPSLMVKQVTRTLAGWRGLGDYKYRERYTISELWKMIFAGDATSIHRPAYATESASQVGHYHGHKGFNWRALRTEINERFHIEALRFTPLSWLGGCFNSQVWFICRPR
jgi:2-polyprenyl-3-methyl-5-hydroxy-6-metoxy-1,4-benzoquinol methylase